MNITKKQMNDINQVQLKMFKEFISVSERLKLNYYLVHGSLLGAVRYNGFFPYDDDIDIAMPRKDYDIFIEKGQKYLSSNLFIQCNKTEPDYPLVFAKLRNSDTTFIQPVLEKLNVNKGIYIDIFPIDNYPTNKFTLFKIKTLEKIYRVRVLAQMNKKRNIIKQIICNISKILLPNFHRAMSKLDNLYKNVPDTNKCILYGGKSTDRCLDSMIFKNYETISFEKIESRIPKMYKEYLTIIYGNYKLYSPSQEYMRGEDLVEISASVIDTNKSYLEYYSSKKERNDSNVK